MTVLLLAAVVGLPLLIKMTAHARGFTADSADLHAEHHHSVARTLDALARVRNAGAGLSRNVRCRWWR